MTMALTSTVRGSRTMILGIIAVVAVVLAWRVLVRGTDAFFATELGPGDTPRANSPLDTRAPDMQWREMLARNPTDASAMVVLALELERQGKGKEAMAAMKEALKLSPGNEKTLISAAGLFLRQGDDAQGLAILRRAVDLYPGAGGQVWPYFSAVFASGRRNDFFVQAVRDNPVWWPSFFGYVCTQATDTGTVLKAFELRLVNGGTNVSASERACLIGRLQHENQWAIAHQAWLNSLPSAQRQRVPFVFNGGFELPPSNIGFDWIAPTMDGVAVDVQPIDGAGGQRALRVEFANKRWLGPPVYQYLMLLPGRYRLEGRSRSDGLETWLGVQWGIYCLAAGGKDGPQLMHTDRVLVPTEWETFNERFNVPGDCPVQVLRLELANPMKGADTPANVVARLRGVVWFDDFRVLSTD